MSSTLIECSLSKQKITLRRNLVSVSNAEGPPVPIPNTEVKLCSAENTCLATGRKDRSMLTQNFIFVFLSKPTRRFPFKRKAVGVSNAEGPPVPIPNTEVKLCCAEDTYLATDRKNRSMPTHRKVTKIKYSSLAQSVERMTVNHDVAGSSPAGGAKQKRSESIAFGSLFIL